MCIVVPPPRLASAAVIFFGQRGDISHHAQQRGVSRQRLYRAMQALRAITRQRQQLGELGLDNP